MIPDGELLRRYMETNSDSAFTELVERHLALVYSAALRQVNGDAHLAQDVAQTVFADLARKAVSLTGRPVLTGWLYTSALFAAAKAVRTEQRRHTREQEAHLMNQLLGDAAPDLDWEKLRPVLDAAMLELNEADREAVLLRYFDNRPHAEIADRLGLSENAARMRVERALEKLHALLSRRGVSTTAALSAVISANAVQVAPAGLAATLSTAALAGSTLASTATATVSKTIAMTTLQKALITAVLVSVVGAGIYEARQAASLRTQIQTLRQQQAEQLIREREAAASNFAGLRDENERLKHDATELLRLRAEATRLRGELNRAEQAAKNQLGGERAQNVAEQSPTNPPPVETYSAKVRETVPWNQILVTGGWKTQSGKRVIVFALLKREQEATQMTIETRLVEFPEDLARKLDVEQFRTDAKDTKFATVLTAQQYESFLKAAQETVGVDLLNAPRITTSSGTAATIAVEDSKATAAGENYKVGTVVTVMPTISADGQSVDMDVEVKVTLPTANP